MSDTDEIRKLRKLCSDLRRVHQENEERYGNAAEALMQLVESKDAEIERLNGLLGWHDTTVPEILRLRRINEDHCKAVNTLTVENSRQADEIERLRGQRDDAVGALRFILAFYEPGQTYLDTVAWKNAEAAGRSAIARADRGDT